MSEQNTYCNIHGHTNLIKLEGPIHENGKAYLCKHCGEIVEVEVKPAEIGVVYGELEKQ